MALYHSARGSVGYTIVGSPTIVDGVASGFSTSDYLHTPEFPFGDNSFEGFTKITMPDTFPAYGQNTGIFATTANRCGILLSSTTTSQTGWRIGFYTWTAAESSPTVLMPALDVEVSTVYYVRFGWDKTKYYIDVSTDKTNWISATRNASNVPIDTNQQFCLGNTDYYKRIFGGAIDLNNTYIKVNGQPWFGICPVEVKKHQIMGPVGYTVSGSPSTENGVLKNVSRTNRVYTSLSLPNFETLEVLIKAKKETTWKGRVLCLCGFGRYDSQERITTNDQSGENQGTRLFYTAAGIIVSIDNSRFDVTQYAPLGYYTRLRVTKNTEDYTYELGLSADKESWVTASANYEDNICTGQVYFLQNSSGVYAADEMSLDETYIKVNGKLWYWQPQATKYIQRNNQLVFADPKLYLSGPVNYEVVGSPTIVDGVASDFTLQDRIITSQNAPTDDITKYSFHIKFKIGTIETAQSVLTYTSSNKEGVVIYKGVLMWLIGRISGSTTDAVINSPVSISQGDEILAEGFYKGNNTFAFRVSKDGGQTWSELTRKIDTSTLTIVRTDLPFYIGTWSNNAVYGNPFKGSIDLNNTYIKINDQLWFYGKNYASQNIAPVPSGYTYGNTTTSAIGYVDMRTQQFTAAPEGASIGRDE